MKPMFLRIMWERQHEEQIREQFGFTLMSLFSIEISCVIYLDLLLIYGDGGGTASSLL